MAKLFGGKKKSSPQADNVDVETVDNEPTADAPEKKKGLGALFNIGGGRTKKGSKDAMLESVVSESEPGAVMERMKVNSLFALPGNMGWVIMVLPTQDESFGGLSKRQSKDADKGNIINLINSDVINCVVTQDLLDDNALGFIPNEQTLERMGEFGVLRDARYMYGVATADPDTGEVFVYLVPPKREESSQGEIFNEVLLVSQGRLALNDVIDFGVVDTMTAIFDRDEDGYGPEGVLEAMGVNMRFIADARKNGTYPTGEELRDNLEQHFPKLLDDDAEGVTDTQEANAEINNAPVDETLLLPVVEDEAEVDSGNEDDTDNGGNDSLKQSAGSTIVGGVSDESAGEVGDEQSAAVIDPADDFVDFEAPSPAQDVADAAGEVNGDGSEGDGEDDLQHEVVPGVPAADFSSMTEEDQRELLEKFGNMSKTQMDALFSVVSKGNTAVLDRLEALRLQIEDQEMARRGIGVSSDREFDRDSVNEGIMQRMSDELDLHVDAAPFHSAFDLAPRQIYQVQSDVQTPWLGDQINRLSVDLNARIIAANQANYEERRRQYLSMLAMLASDIRDNLDYHKDGTKWSRAYNAIERDQKQSWGQFETMIANRHRELSEGYDSARERYVAEKTARASEEYDRINLARHQSRMAAAENEIVNLFESMGDASRSQLDEARKTEAQRQLNLGISRVTEALMPLMQAHEEEEERMFNEAMDVIDEYIEKWRTDDIKQAAVWDEKLAKDARLESAIDEYEQREEKIKSDTQARVAVLEETLTQQRENFAQQLAERDALVEAARSNADARVVEVEDQMARLQRTHEVELDENKRHMDEMIAQAGERALQSEENSKYFIESQKQQNWLLITIMVVIAVAFGAGGIAVGVFML